MVLVSRAIGGSGRPDVHRGREGHSHKLGEHRHHKDQQVSTYMGFGKRLSSENFHVPYWFS